MFSKTAHFRPRLCRGSVTRRSFLEVGSLGLSGLGLADLLRLRAEASPTGSFAPDTAVILVWLSGGPPHMETYDMKPEAPAEYRGEFRPIRTNVPGIEVCELLPLHAKVADRFTLIRSITHNFSDHGGGAKRVMTGRLPRSPVGFVNDAPAGAAIVSKMREQLEAPMPRNILLGDLHFASVDGAALGAAYLGPAYRPFEIFRDPHQPNAPVRNLQLSQEVAARLSDRQALLSGLDSLRRHVDQSGAMEAMDKYSQQAYQLLTDENTVKAFDLSQEDAKTRERYGKHGWGERLLLARRLVEAGSSFVTAVLDNPSGIQPTPLGTIINWDSHAVNGHIFNDARWRMPFYDQAVTALIEDVYRRGIDKKVLVVVTGEFGRSPRLEDEFGTSTGVRQPGRGHWPSAMSVLVSGGGVRTGQVIGSTNSKGEVPKDRPLTPNDLWATIYRHLGIDYNHAFLDHSGRPMPILPFGEPIRELV